MKKLTTALLAAGLVLSASACAEEKLTTAETCERISAVVSSPGGAGKTGMIRLANAIRPIEAVSSDELQPALQAILDYADESSKDNPDAAKLEGLRTEYENAGSAYSQYCGG